MEKATFGAGCFWGVQAEFDKLDGVISTAVGYAGGSFDNPTYQDVCTGNTGHAEVLQIEFESEKTSYKKLLNLFWKIHDPTTSNRQGPDVGSQYRSIILTHNKEQEKSAADSKNDLQKNGIYNSGIVTEITSMDKFYKAEEYHQNYFNKK
ncbi:MAG TPA: peptide-methionine (S)-S-oxide reductase [Ignavibacteria bacterium]|nr:peptide-methionine (S)-S-oxide reductase [Ignavibacteria bacterium]